MHGSTVRAETVAVSACSGEGRRLFFMSEMKHDLHNAGKPCAQKQVANPILMHNSQVRTLQAER